MTVGDKISEVVARKVNLEKKKSNRVIFSPIVTESKKTSGEDARLERWLKKI